MRFSDISSKRWLATPRDATVADFDRRTLAAQWSRLHRSDCEPYPTAESLAPRLRADKSAASPQAMAAKVQEAWRAYHRGQFQRARELGAHAGLPGFAAALKATGVYASEVEKNEHQAQQLLLDASEQAERTVERLPGDANAHYLLAFTLGRYSQRISVVEAMARGLAGRIAASLERTLKLAPEHAEAHAALGVYHAEIVAKLGALAAALTYGASAKKAVEFFKKAIKLNPDDPSTPLEYANGLRLLAAREHATQIEALLTDTARCEPADAAQWLVQQRSRALLGLSETTPDRASCPDPRQKV